MTFQQWDTANIRFSSGSDTAGHTWVRNRSLWRNADSYITLTAEPSLDDSTPTGKLLVRDNEPVGSSPKRYFLPLCLGYSPRMNPFGTLAVRASVMLCQERRVPRNSKRLHATQQSQMHIPVSYVYIPPQKKCFTLKCFSSIIWFIPSVHSA